MNWKERLKQFFCSHWGKATSEVRGEKGTIGYHSYCSDCKKTFGLFIAEEATEQQKEFILKKI